MGILAEGVACQRLLFLFMGATTVKDSQIRMENLVDLDILQRIQDTFAQALNLAAVTVDRDGKPITATSNFSQTCLMIRSTAAGLARCQLCDAEGGRVAHARQEPYAYTCEGGFLDAAAPIIIEGEYVGCILCGQVVPEDDQEAFIQNVIARNVPLGLDPEALEAAARQNTVLSRESFQAAVEMLAMTAKHIIEMSAANIAQAKLLREMEKRASLQKALQESQLRALKAQINPHFLFNTLTLLGYTAMEESASRTEEIAYGLSDLLRYSLRNMSTTVELAEEMEIVAQYLEIQKVRFGERLQSEISLDPALERHEIPCMILQPLVENAVIHGAEPLLRTVTVRVQATVQGSCAVIEVSDNGTGIMPEIAATVNQELFDESSNSLGLQNVIRRLRGEYGKAFRFRITGVPGKGTNIRLYIPKEGEALTENEAPPAFVVPVANGTGNQIELD